jgi:KaiC/GvpD/RAD55 family RecA-like ATPase
MDAGQQIYEYGPKTETSPQEEIFDLSSQKSATKTVLDRIESIIMKIGITRLVLDSVASLPHFIKSRDADKKLIAQVVNSLKQKGVTILLLSEQHQEGTYDFHHYLANGVFQMYNNAIPKIQNLQSIGLKNIGTATERSHKRAFQVLKLQRTKHDTKLHSMHFSDSGLVIKDKS